MADARNILIVEDEPLIAMMVEDFVGILGHGVAGTADNADEAIALIEAGGIDAAIIDVNLRGGEKSWPVAAALADRDIPFVLASGGSGDAIDPAYRDRPTLAKPFTMDGVRQALDALD